MSTDFAAALRQAAPYINAHRGKTCVAYLPGEAALREDFPELLFDIALAHGLGLQLVLVLGARPQIASRLEEAGIAEQYIDGVRVTDANSLRCVKQVVGALRSDVEAILSTALASTPLGGRRVEVVGGNLVTAQPCGIRNGVDLHYSGELRRIATKAMRAHLEAGRIVLLPCLGTSPTGESFNLRSEDLAVAVAAELQCEKLLLLSSADVPAGECTPAALATIDGLSEGDRQLATKALKAGVPRVHLQPLSESGGVLEELYTRSGSGLLISHSVADSIRPAAIDDIGGLLNLIRPREEEGTLVPRSREQLELDVQHFSVMEHDGEIIGCRALIPAGDGSSAELACVAVAADWRHGGRAAALLESAEKEAHSKGIKQIFVLTTRAAHFFTEHGFEAVDPEALPAPRQTLYNWQRRSVVLSKSI